MPGYYFHDVQDFADAPAGDAVAARLCAVHCTPRQEPRSLTARISAVADRVAGRDLDAAARHDLDSAVARLLAAVSELEDAA